MADSGAGSVVGEEVAGAVAAGVAGSGFGDVAACAAGEAGSGFGDVAAGATGEAGSGFGDVAGGAAGAADSGLGCSSATSLGARCACEGSVVASGFIASAGGALGAGFERGVMVLAADVSGFGVVV